MPAPESLLVFLACVAVATVIQNLTAFAFGLVFLGLVELLEVVPMADAINTSMVLALVNSIAFFWGDREPLPWKQVTPVAMTSVAGVAIGLGVHVWLSANASHWLRLLLGIVVILSAANLLFAGRVRSEPSSSASFALFGGLSGLLGGLFATSGPPIVYHMLRQPFEPRHIRRCLMLIFAINNLSRLLMVAGAGRLSHRSVVLCFVAVPVAFVVTRMTAHHAARISKRRLVALMAALLFVTGATLAVSALRLTLP
jgi:uncharacterized membrane protein YfcA